MSDTPTPIGTVVSGRFQPGNRAAAGRQSRGQKLRAAILASISRDDVIAITQSLVQQAIGGDLGAAKILLGYIGKPSEAPAVAVQVNQSTEYHQPGMAAKIIERLRKQRDGQ